MPRPPSSLVMVRSKLVATVAAGLVLLASCGADEPDGQPATRPAPFVLLDARSKTVLDQDVAYPGGGPAQVSSVIVELPAGTSTGWHRHDAPMYAYVLEGTVTVTYEGGVERTYPAGTALLEAIGTYHNGENRGITTVRILTVNMGVEGLANTVARP